MTAIPFHGTRCSGEQALPARFFLRSGDKRCLLWRRHGKRLAKAQAGKALVRFGWKSDNDLPMVCPRARRRYPRQPAPFRECATVSLLPSKWHVYILIITRAVSSGQGELRNFYNLQAKLRSEFNLRRRIWRRCSPLRRLWRPEAADRCSRPRQRRPTDWFSSGGLRG